MSSPPPFGSRLRAGLLLSMLALAAPARAAESKASPPLLFAPAGVDRYAIGTSYELSWGYGSVPFAPGAGLRAGSLRLRETNGPVVTIITTVLAAIGGSAAASDNAKAAYARGEISRQQAQARIDEADRQAQELLTSGYHGAIFDTDFTVYSDKFGGQISGWDLREWLGKRAFELGPTRALFEWGLKGARIWGPTFAPADQRELFDHVHAGGMLQLRANVTRWGEVGVRWEPNLLRFFGAESHESPLTVGAWLHLFEQLFVGAEAVWTGLAAQPAGAQIAAGVRL